jgi:hypothetical protein
MGRSVRKALSKQSTGASVSGGETVGKEFLNREISETQAYSEGLTSVVLNHDVACQRT